MSSLVDFYADYRRFQGEWRIVEGPNCSSPTEQFFCRDVHLLRNQFSRNFLHQGADFLALKTRQKKKEKMLIKTAKTALEIRMSFCFFFLRDGCQNSSIKKSERGLLQDRCQNATIIMNM